MTRWEEYRDCAERVAREVLGEPNRRLSKGRELRWGTNGSMALDLERGFFYDHEVVVHNTTAAESVTGPAN